MAGSDENGSADLLALAAAGWRPEDLRWESLQEQAAEAVKAGRADVAPPLWAEALRLARANFAANDPRLATSLANQAVALRRAGERQRAEELLAEALGVWQAAQSWLAGMQLERRSRSSTFHLRLESKHKGAYDHFSRDRAQALADEGSSATQELRKADTSAGTEDRFARWCREKPSGFSDTRKLMAAALLTAAD